ncbi:serine/threonine-protein kinase [Streptomyces sp. NBC_01233]|uniref:serine/threonine-protein kinase n=1 Tax=Streptomyces sp. NBC_01233 TaxID=2903787 RepID=UPI002E133E7E|nr:serine/threonine protein kinase [Streptomyces sp. NBC_01233]
MEPLREDDPETIGPYRLFALLGRGGWGNVYFARSEFGRGVALKTIRPEHLAGNPERFRRRFAREVEAARAVDSTYTAQVVDADTHAAEPWLAARYIRGVDLAEALDHCGAPLPQRTWRVLAAGLADALRSIHAADLVHRDLKLANILLAGDGPYVIDFGIARNLSPAGGATLTGSGAAPRTVTFSSPEQLRDERVGPASDVFALGVVLAYAALNRHPFGPGSEAQIQANILHGHRRLGGLPSAVEEIVLPCLEPGPQDRPTPVELAGLLPSSVSPKEHEWLPPGLRSALAGLSDLAVDLAAPMRYPRLQHEPPVLPGPGRPLAATPTSSAVRAVRERDFPPAPPRASFHEATTRPPTGAGPTARQVSPPAAPKAAPPVNPPVAPARKAAAGKAYAGEPGGPVPGRRRGRELRGHASSGLRLPLCPRLAASAVLVPASGRGRQRDRSQGGGSTDRAALPRTAGPGRNPLPEGGRGWGPPLGDAAGRPAGAGAGRAGGGPRVVREGCWAQP